MHLDERLKAALDRRKTAGALRSLPAPASDLIDFMSNDYLGFSRLPVSDLPSSAGATGSRLISGSTAMHQELEKVAARFHRADAALLFNSGYDANLAVAACLADRHDTILYDERSHASIRDGVRLSNARAWSFRHNDCGDLARKLERARGAAVVIVESVYSMDGDIAPLEDLVQVCAKFEAALLVDEAHGSGVFGPHGEGVCVDRNLESKIYGRIHTFGKAFGSHGAVVVGSKLLVRYLTNFARSFIYTTALPPACAAVTLDRYRRLTTGTPEIQDLRDVISLFDSVLGEFPRTKKLHQGGDSQIRAFVLRDSIRARALALELRGNGVNAYPVLAATVPRGTERLRICLHTFNTEEEIRLLFRVTEQFLERATP